MMKKYLCVGVLTIAMLLQSAAVNCADNSLPGSSDITNTAESASPSESTETQGSKPVITDEQEQLKKKQEQLKKEQEQSKKEQEQLKKAQEQLKKEQAQLKSEQEKAKKAQEQSKKDQKKSELQSKQKKLNSQISSSTYLSYLKQLGYYRKIYKNDEKLNVRNCLLLFQSNHNMNVTGYWDQATKAMLINRLLSTSFTYPDTVKKAPTTGKWIVVNKTNRTLTLYQGNKAIKKYAVCVGNPASLTKSGKFIINNKLIDPDWGGGGFSKPIKGGTPQNPLGSRWLGINRTDGSYGIHGTNTFYSIGTYASHGCIRMQNYCVEELFPLVSMRASVWVGTQAELKNWGITQNAFQAL